jgi:hypothetical protein
MQLTEYDEYEEKFNISIMPPIAHKKSIIGITANELLNNGTICSLGGDALKECEELYN